MDGGNQRTEAEGIRILVRIKDSVRLLSVGIRLDRYSKMVVIGTVIAVARRHINHLFMNHSVESNKNPQTENPLPHIGPQGLKGSPERFQMSIQATVDDVCHGSLVQLARKA